MRLFKIMTLVALTGMIAVVSGCGNKPCGDSSAIITSEKQKISSATLNAKDEVAKLCKDLKDKNPDGCEATFEGKTRKFSHKDDLKECP